MLASMHKSALDIRALSFDLFDTLVDLHLDDLPEYRQQGRLVRGTQPQVFAALPAGLGISFQEFQTALGEVDRELRERHHAEGRETPTLLRFRTLAERLDLELTELPERLTQVHMGSLRSCARAPRHHAQLLRALAQRRPIALCSNFSHAPTARAILREFELADSIRHIVISEEVGFRKPRPEIFRAVVEALDLPPAQILHIGDRLDADVAGAARAGLRTAWLRRRVPAGELADAKSSPKPDLTLEDLCELTDLLS